MNFLNVYNNFITGESISDVSCFFFDTNNEKRKRDELLYDFDFEDNIILQEERPKKFQRVENKIINIDLFEIFTKYLIPFLEYKDFIRMRNTCKICRLCFSDYGLFLYSPAYINIFNDLSNYKGLIRNFLKSQLQSMRKLSNEKIIVPINIKNKSGFLETIIDKSKIECLTLQYDPNHIPIFYQDYDSIEELLFINSILHRDMFFKDTTILIQFINLKKITFCDMSNMLIVDKIIKFISKVNEVIFINCDTTHLKLNNLALINSITNLEFDKCIGLNEERIIKSFYIRVQIKYVFNCINIRASFNELFFKIQKDIAKKICYKCKKICDQLNLSIKELYNTQKHVFISKTNEVMNSIKYVDGKFDVFID
jgi:hypothetical protein